VLARALGDLDDVAFAINNQGLVALGLGKPDVARAHLLESLALRRKTGSGWGVANSVYNQGLVATALGAHAEAATHYREAMDRFEGMNDARGMSLALTGIGSASTAVGDYAAAVQFFQSAVRAGEQLGDPFATATARLGEGTARWLQAAPRAARPLLEASLATFREIGDRAGMSRALLALGQITAAADPATASRLQREALALAREAALPWGEALAEAHLAQTALAIGDRGEASVWLRRAVERALELHVVPLILRALLPAHALLEPSAGLALLRFIGHHPGSEHEVRETARRLAADSERAGVVPSVVPSALASSADASEVARRVMQALQG
jgi:tetratricopeptide (TPR) repeat protein